ncbi:MAG: VCBS repeat-containing protein [Candidatus Eremiobacterota bacterium]
MHSRILILCLTAALALLGVSATGCGEDSVAVGGGQPQVGTATVIVRHTLLRAVPANVTAFRFIGFDSNGNLAFGPEVRAKAAEVVLTVPVTVVDFHIEYLVGNTVIGLFQTNLSLTPGATVILEDPAWVDVGGGGVGPPTQLAFLVQPSNGAPNQVLAPTAVALQDAAGNTVTTAADPITVALGQNPTGATLGGTLTLNPVNGVATFNTLTVNLDGTYTLAATAGALTGTSNAFTISTQPLATTLNFVTQPTGGLLGQALTPAVDVEVLDQFGARLATFNGSLTALLGVNPVGASLTGGNATAAGGLASFNALVLNKAGVGFTLVVNGAGLAPVTSLPFDITVARLTFNLLNTSLVCPAQAIPGAGGGNLFAVASGDFNGDGRADMVVADETRNHLRVFLRQANGSFTTRDLTVTGCSQVAVGDVNGDTFPDLVTLNLPASTKSVLLGNGDGTFQAAATTAAPASARSLAVGDLTGDGLADVAIGSNFDADEACANIYHSTAGVLPGAPTAQLRAGAGVATGSPNAVSIAISQFDANPLPDLTFARTSTAVAGRGINVLLNYDAGTMTVGTTNFTAINATFGPCLAVGDFDGANGNDVAALATTTVHAIVNDGAGTFAVATGSPFVGLIGSSPGTATTMVAGDFDGDAAAELAACNVGSSGNGQSAVRVLNQPAAPGNLFDATTVNSQAALSPRSITAADFNGDGLLDVGLVNNSGVNVAANACVMIRTGNNRFGPPHLGDTNADGSPDFNSGDCALADMNGDGLPDIVCTVADPVNNRVAVFLATGPGTYPTNPNVFILGNESGGALFNTASAVAVANFDGNPGNDVAVLATDAGTFTRSIRFFVSNGASPPVFSEPAGSSVATNGGAQLSVADLDGNGFPDLIANRSVPTGLRVCTNAGAFPFAAVDVATTGGGSFAVGNFDGVAGDDAVILNLFNFEVLRNTGGVLAVTGTVSSPGGQNMTRLALGDVTGDGFLDVVAGSVSAAAPGQLFVFAGNGAGAFPSSSSQTDLTLVAGTQTLRVADANGDGLQDVFVANRDNADVSILLGRGNGTFEQAGCALLAGFASGFAVADLNGDNRVDFVTANGGPVETGGVTVVIQQ